MVSLDAVKSKKKAVGMKNKSKRNMQKVKPNFNKRKAAEIATFKKRFKTENIIPGPGKKKVAKESNLKIPNGVIKKKSLKNKLNKDLEIKSINDKGNDTNSGMKYSILDLEYFKSYFLQIDKELIFKKYTPIDEDGKNSEYSLDDDEDFFRKPERFVCNDIEMTPLDLVPDTDKQEENPWLLDIEEQSNAIVTKILVYEDIFDETEANFESEAEPEEELEAESKTEPDDKEETMSKAEQEVLSKVKPSNDSSADQSETPIEQIIIDDDDDDESQIVENSADIFAGTKLDTELLDSDPLDSESQEPKPQDSKPQDSKPLDSEPLSSEPLDSKLLELSVFENSLKTNDVLAVLKQDMELYGTVVVTLLCGRITINGYKARPFEPLTIFSPKGLNWVVISPMANKKLPKDKFNWNDLNNTFSRAQLDKILGNYDGHRDAIVLLQRNSGSQKLQSTFAKHMAENVFPLVYAANRPHYSSEYILNCLVQWSDKSKGVQVPTVWTKLALQASTRLMVTGGKGVGKSTMLRYLVNRHLHHPYPRLLLIDLDIGQPELFVPQTVSCSIIDAPLLGHGLFLNKQPERAYVVGHVNIVMCAEQYARAVRQLLSYCHGNPDYQGIPWLINTMGYNKGFGLELMALIADCVQPTDVVQIASNRPINNFDEPLDWKFLSKVKPIIYVTDEFKINGSLPKYAHHHIQSVVPPVDRTIKDWKMSAKDVRYVNLLARLSTTLRGNAKHLTECLPVQVNLQQLQIEHLTSEDYTREELIAGMEANLVYLCKSSTNSKIIECLGIGKSTRRNFD